MLMCEIITLQNGTGFLSRSELAQMLRDNGVALSQDQLNTMFGKLDAVRILYLIFSKYSQILISWFNDLCILLEIYDALLVFYSKW